MKQGEQIRRTTGTRGTVEQEETSIASQRLGKQVFTATGTQATIEKLFGTMFLFGPYKVIMKKS
jgi:hypothetical protein